MERIWLDGLAVRTVSKHFSLMIISFMIAGSSRVCNDEYFQGLFLW